MTLLALLEGASILQGRDRTGPPKPKKCPYIKVQYKTSKFGWKLVKLLIKDQAGNQQVHLPPTPKMSHSHTINSLLWLVWVSLCHLTPPALLSPVGRDFSLGHSYNGTARCFSWITHTASRYRLKGCSHCSILTIFTNYSALIQAFFNNALFHWLGLWTTPVLDGQMERKMVDFFFKRVDYTTE